MYKSKQDCNKHQDMLQNLIEQQNKFFELNSTTVTIKSLPEVYKNLYILFEEQHSALTSLVEDNVITVEMFFYDISHFLTQHQKDVADLRRAAIKNDPDLSPDQKTSLIAEKAGLDTLEGSMHKEIATKVINSLFKKGDSDKGGPNFN